MTRAEAKAAGLAVKLGPNSPLHVAKSAPVRVNADEEHQIQVRYFEWAETEGAARWPELGTALLHAVPNGGKRGKLTSWKMKLEGVKRGVLDISLDVARRGYFGAKIETKKPGAVPSAEQRTYGVAVSDQGYYVVWCETFEELRDATIWYMSGEPTFSREERYNANEWQPKVPVR